MNDIRMSIKGVERLQAILDELPKRLKKNALRRGMNKSGRHLANAAKPRAPKESGLLRLSMGHREIVSGGMPGAAVGPRTGFRRLVIKKKRGGLRRATKREETAAKNPFAGGSTERNYRDPAKYGHLVEKGHRIVRGKGFAGTRLGKAVVKAGGRLFGRGTRDKLRRGLGGRMIGHVAARPFLGPALAAEKDAILQILAEECAGELMAATMGGGSP
jgi:hypothetical protein